MKKLLLLLILTVCNVAYAESTEKLVDITSDSTRSGNAQESLIYDGVKEFMAATASSLKVTVGHVYEVLVKQQLVYSITWLIVTMVMILFTYGIYRIIKWVDSLPNADTPEIGFLVVFLIVVNIIGYLTVLCHLNTMVTGFVNPEMGAIYEIMDYIKELKQAAPKP